ncbi:MAG: 3',5'-nucleoside bisphosphate phosphatase [Burkholderiaceae bacterium]
MTRAGLADDALLADPWRLNADLHCHSMYSDGVLRPAELVRRAGERGVSMLALTDHDDIEGLPEAAAAAADHGLIFVPGVEISVTWAGKTIHVVGLGIDPQAPALVQGLARIRSVRDGRAREIGDSLGKAGIAGAYEGALEHVRNPALVSRTHFARFLVQAGVCESVNDVFQHYLVEGRPGYVPQQWARLGEAVQWILAAGGTAIVAHPGRYKLDETALWAFMGEFREAGGTAIEVITGSHTRDQYRRFATVAREFGFMASRGSDFHGPGESRVDLGDLPLLPDSVVPVWHDWPQALLAQPVSP